MHVYGSGDGPRFDGTVALVTGAAQGIGARVAAALAAAGARVAACDHVPPTEPSDVGGPVTDYRLDVSDPTAVQAVVQRVEADLGPIDCLVNVAGLLRTGPVVELSDDDWAVTFATNSTGVFLVSRAVARLMTARERGAIVTVGSNAAGVPRTGMAGYAASKAAATMFTKCLGLELAPHGIRCNVVSPGSTDTPMQRSMWSDGGGADAVIEGDPTAFRVGIPLGRLADPSDIADAVLFLLSDRARHITLHDLYVDGGATLRH